MDQPKNEPITLRIELMIPTCQNVELKTPPRSAKMKAVRSLTIQHPDPNGTTYAQEDCERWHVCANGTAGGDVQHVFAKTYNGLITTTPAEPPVHPDTLWTRPEAATGIWQFDMLPLDGSPGAGNPKTLVVWSDTGDDYGAPMSRTFTAIAATYTYCNYGSAQELKSPTGQLEDWAKMPDRWGFTIQGSSKKSCANCDCLNGDWIVTRDPKCRPELLWHLPLKYSFTDPHQPSVWRLSFSHGDGFWYLDCVANLQQAIGTWISYRRHASAWNPVGPNEMLLMTDSGYCNVPDRITLVPL